MSIIDPGCTTVNPTLENCASERGNLFASNRSTSWSTEDLSNGIEGAVYTLLTYEESFLSRQGNGSYGFDTVRLGLPGSNAPSLGHQLIAGIATNDFFLGTLGLSPLPFNFSSMNDPQPSLLGTLRNDSLISSSSWAYTAGASYKNPPVFGSLTLEGFDTSRHEVNNVSFAFGADVSRDLLVNLRSITYDTTGSYPLLASTVDMFINSLRFNLTWNEQAQIYLVSEQAHRSLVAQNPEFTFALAPSRGEGTTGDVDNRTVEIILPYAAFDLNLSMPIVGNSTRWFPLKRAQNATQYTLGRTFLQEAYVIADYERKNFSVSQALFPATSVSANLVAIEVPLQRESPDSKSGLGAGAIAGIAVGAVAVVVSLAAGFWIWRRQKKRTQTAAPVLNSASIVATLRNEKGVEGQVLEVDSSLVNEVDGSRFIRPELASGNRADGRHELPTQENPHELSGKAISPVELEAHVP